MQIAWASALLVSASAHAHSLFPEACAILDNTYDFNDFNDLCCMQAGNKGAACVSWSIAPTGGALTHFLAICCHLEAHTHRLHKRDANARHILSSLHMHPPPSPKGLTQTVLSSFLPSVSSPLHGRSRSRTCSPMPRAVHSPAPASPEPAHAAPHMRAHTLPGPEVVTEGALHARLGSARPGQGSPLRRSLHSSVGEMSRQLCAPESKQQSAPSPSTLSAERMLPYPRKHGSAKRRDAERSPRRPYPAFDAKDAGCSNKGTQLASSLVAHMLQQQEHQQQHRCEAPSTAWREADGAQSSCAQLSASAEAHSGGQAALQLIPASQGCHLDSLNAWQHSSAPHSSRNPQSKQRSDSATSASFDFAARQGAGALEAPTPRLLQHGATDDVGRPNSPYGPVGSHRAAVHALRSLAPLQAPRSRRLDTWPQESTTVLQQPGARSPPERSPGRYAAGSSDSSPSVGAVCEGAESWHQGPGSECSSMHMSGESPCASRSAVCSDADVASAAQLPVAGSLQSAGSEAAARAYLACMARLEAASRQHVEGTGSSAADALAPSNPTAQRHHCGAPTVPDALRTDQARDASTLEASALYVGQHSTSAAQSSMVPVPVVSSGRCWPCAVSAKVRARHVCRMLGSAACTDPG